MTNTPDRPTREECEALLNRPLAWPPFIQYTDMEVKRLARAYLELLTQREGLMARIRNLDMRQGELVIERDQARDTTKKLIDLANSHAVQPVDDPT